nr:EAL domain-containing protein [Fredinandcohnia sp. SECRCQ15]
MLLNIVRKSNGRRRNFWTILSSITLGIGIWTTHFIGIAALKNVATFHFNIGFLVASFIIILCTSFLGMLILTRSNISVLAASITFTIGISAMHYLGMYSYHTLSMSLNNKWFLLAVFIGFIFSLLCCTFFKKEWGQTPSFKSGIKVGGWLGFSFTAIHYISMNGAVHHAHHHPEDANLEQMIIFIVLGVIFLVFATIISNFYQQKLIKQMTKLKYQERYYRSLYDLNPDAIFMLDTEGNILNMNEAAAALSGFEIEEVLGGSFKHLIYKGDLNFMADQFLKSLEGKIIESEIRIYTTSNRVLDVYVKVIPVEIDGEVIGFYVVLRDITDIKSNILALQNAESKYRSIVEENFVGVFIQQHDYIIYANAMMSKMFGYSTEELQTLTYWDIVAEEDHPYLKEKISKRIQDNQTYVHFSMKGKQKNGEHFYIKVHSSQFSFHNDLAFICSVIDVTEHVQSLKKVKFMAYHDSLTNLPNHRKLTNDLTEKIAQHESFSVMFLDLNAFKKTNDRYGHLAGDAVLKEVATRLNNLALQNTAYHIGGDEFTIVLLESDHLVIKEIAEKIALEIRKPILYKGHTLQISTSIGVANYPSDGENIEELLRKADLAMYTSKERFNNECVFYQAQLLTEVEERFQMEEDLKIAIDKEQFFLCYQPQVHLLTGELSGVEALIRWNHPKKGLLPPNVFIPLLEETGLIVEVGEWIIKDVFESLRNWMDRGYELPSISINISAKQFGRQNIYNLIDYANKGKRVCLQKLNIEITESAMIDFENSLDMIQKLKQLGLKISLDDFGTGYSSLSILHRLPIDYLKIDRSFISGFDKDSKVVIEMILTMAKRLNVKVVAEGIEKQEQIDFLIKEGCDYGQGYFFSKPLLKSEFEQIWLSK